MCDVVRCSHAYTYMYMVYVQFTLLAGITAETLLSRRLFLLFSGSFQLLCLVESDECSLAFFTTAATMK